MKKLVLVVGGAGYIGSFTVKALINDGWDVCVFDDLSCGHRQAVHPDAKFFEGTLAEPSNLDRVFERSFSAVVHFAARTSVPESVRVPLDYYRSNVAYTVNLLEAMRRANVTQLVFSSTAAVYGDPVGDMNEEHPTIPINPYGRTKLTVERMLEDLAVAGELKAIALRYFNACGASEDGLMGEDHTPETHLLPLMVQAALGARPPLKLFGNDYPTADGTCVRDYIHVEDLAKAHVLALEHLQKVDQPMFRSFNVGTGSGTSIQELLSICGSVLGSSVPVELAPRRPGDPAVLVAQAERICKELGWEPRYQDMAEIVRTVVRWTQLNPEGYRSFKPET